MGNVCYPALKRLLATGAIDLENDDVRALLVDTNQYALDPAHDVLADIPAGARVATSGTLAGRVTTLDEAGDAVLDADPALFASAFGEHVGAIVVYADSGDPATSPLLWFLDRDADGVTPIAMTPTGGRVVVEWYDGSSRLLRLR